MRLDKPIGILLLWLPTARALWIANQGKPPLHLLIYFLAGTIVMRSAGCVVNDMADRNIDKHVKRTAMRPLTTGEVSQVHALGLIGLLLLIALGIVMMLARNCFYLALVAVALTVLYPFCKRFLQAPQLVLGLAFSMGIPMAFIASGVSDNTSMLILLLINFAWIVSYDTMYAMVDRDDDLRIGVKSTAVLFAQYDRGIILLLQLLLHCGWFYLAWSLHYSARFFTCWAIASLVLIYQQKLVHSRNNAECFKAFKFNAYYGFFIWMGLW